MLPRPLLLVIAALGITLRGFMGNQVEIRQAALAPFVAVEHRMATSLCDDFTVAAAGHLARSYSNSKKCPVRVREVFALASRGLPSHTTSGVNAEMVTGIVMDGKHAIATMRFRAAPAVVRHISLEEVGGRWRISTFPVLVVVKVCRGHSTHGCRKVVALSVANATSEPVPA